MTRRRKQSDKIIPVSENQSNDLSRKYRPSTLDEFIGNTSLKSTFESLFRLNKIPQQILFYGPKGCGKTTLARLCAKQLNCSEFDLKEIDTADFRGIDSVREIRRTMHTSPMKGKVKVYILDECHKTTNDFQNALLKALEEPPKHVYFFLCTTDPQGLIPTIKSRCVQYQVSTLTPKQIFELMDGICKKENRSVPKKVILQIAKDCEGHPRNALKILEKIIYLNEDEMLEAAKHEAEKKEAPIELCRALMSNKSWKQIATLFKSINDEPETIRRIIRGYFASVLLNGNTTGYIVLDVFKQPYYNTDGKNELVRGLYEVWSELNE